MVVVVDVGVASSAAPAEAFPCAFGWNILPKGFGFES